MALRVLSSPSNGIRMQRSLPNGHGEDAKPRAALHTTSRRALNPRRASAGTAVSPLSVAQAGVLLVPRMAVLAVRLASMASPHADAAQDVLALRNYFQMRRVHAGAVSAEVIELEPGRDGADE